MEKHWTADSVDAFVYRIATDFFGQIETRLEDAITHKEFAGLLDRTPSRVSQILNNPGNPTVKNMVRCARALGMKVAIIAYDDDDPENRNGPIVPDVFTKCWERAGRPLDLFALEGKTTKIWHLVVKGQADEFYRPSSPVTPAGPQPTYLPPQPRMSRTWIEQGSPEGQHIRQANYVQQ